MWRLGEQITSSKQFSESYKFPDVFHRTEKHSMRLFVQNFKPDQSSKLYRLPLKFRRKTAQPNCKGLMHRFLNLSSLQVGIISLIGFLTTLLKTNPEASCIDCSIRAAFRMVSVSLWVLLQNCSNPVQRLNTQVIESE